MAVLRPHLALTVTDVKRSIPFYEALLGVERARRHGISGVAVRHSGDCLDVEDVARGVADRFAVEGLGVLAHRRLPRTGIVGIDRGAFHPRGAVDEVLRAALRDTGARDGSCAS